MKKIITLMSIVFIAISLTFVFGTSAVAQNGTYFAFGDSIAAGYGLSSPSSDSYPAIISNNFSLSLKNLAVSGDTSAGMLRIISNTPSAKNANLITISIGGNDVITNRSLIISKALYNKLTASGILSGSSAITIIKGLSSMIDDSYFDAESVNFDTIDEDIDRIYDTLEKNLTDSIYILRANNPDAIIMVQTLYNPYINNSEYRILGYDIGELIDEFINRINATYEKVQNKMGDTFVIVDVASGMNGNSKYFYSDWDFHPTAEGHAYIASVISSKYSSLTKTTATTSTTETTSTAATGAITANTTTSYETSQNTTKTTSPDMSKNTIKTTSPATSAMTKTTTTPIVTTQKQKSTAALTSPSDITTYKSNTTSSTDIPVSANPSEPPSNEVRMGIITVTVLVVAVIILITIFKTKGKKNKK